MDYKAIYSSINSDLYRIDMMRKEYIERIHEMLSKDETIDICSEENDAFEGYDGAYVTFHDHWHDCDTQESVESFDYDGAGTSSAFVLYEDMTITELMQCFRCIVEFKEWKETGKITYE